MYNRVSHGGELGIALFAVMINGIGKDVPATGGRSLRMAGSCGPVPLCLSAFSLSGHLQFVLVKMECQECLPHLKANIGVGTF